MKKLLGILLTIVLALTFGFKMVNAESLSPTCKTIGEDETRYIGGNLTVHHQFISTMFFNRNETSGKIGAIPYGWYDHTVSWVDFDSSEYKIVTYSGNNPDEWRALTTAEAAKEYEETHPGWLVVAGTNGDFFKNSISSSGYPATNEPTGNYMSEGNMLHANTTGIWYRQTIGFNPDGSHLHGEPTISNNMFVRVNKDGQFENVAEISNINTASSSGVTLVTYQTEKVRPFHSKFADTTDTTGATVYTVDYSLNRITVEGYQFARGVISDISTSTTSVSPTKGKFYLVDKEGKLSSLKVGDEVKAEYTYLDKWANVENSIGYVYPVLENGKPKEDEENVEFVFYQHPRTLLGFKEDGGMVLMVVDGRGTNAEKRIGVSLPECGELLRTQGCVEGYNFDGGGSSTLIARNEFGGFDVVNTPSDGVERHDGNHMLVVMRDPGFDINRNIEFNKITLSLDSRNDELFNELKNIKVSLNGTTVDYNGELVFDGLTKETEYVLDISYDTKDIYDESKTVRKSYKMNFTTPDFNYPDPLFKVESISKNEITISRSMSVGCASMIKNIVVHCGSNDYNMGDKDKFVCNDLFDDTEYKISYSFDYCLDTGETFSHNLDGETIHTLSYNLPKIVTFEEKDKEDGKLTINYKYEDDDDCVEEAYILINGEKHPLSKASGKVEFKDLDFANNDYELVLVLKYTDGEVRSEALKYEAEGEVTPTPGPTPGPDVEIVPTPPKKGKCGKKNIALITSLISASIVIGLVLRKRH